jgi:lambda repressor-like predicted transcriptional regulator
MHPELIKAHIRMRNTTPAAIADDLGVSRTAVAQAITGKTKSPRIRGYLSKLLGKHEGELWPDDQPRQPGLRRPSGRKEGAYERQYHQGELLAKRKARTAGVAA